jgi:hypothetical protein
MLPPSLTACAARPSASTTFSARFDTVVLPERDWFITGGAAGRVRVSNGAAVIEAVPGSPLAIEALFVPREGDPVRALAADERLSWTAQVTPQGSFFVICEAAFGPAPLLLQQTWYGFHVTARDTAGEVRGFEIAEAVRQRHGPQRWRLERHGRSLRLSLGERELLTGTVPAALTRLAFGETRSDEQHGGRLELRDVRYERQPIARRD